MFRRILVPLDGSSRAERALPVAALLARASQGSVVLIRVVHTATECWPALEVNSGLVESIIEANLEEAQTYLTDIAASSIFKDIPVEVLVRFGPVASTILEEVSSHSIDLVVICSHGSTGMMHAIMGSVAERVSQHAPVPVFVLRERGSVPAGPHPDALQPLKILVGLDGSAYAKEAIAPTIALISALAAPAQGALHLLHVIKPTDYQHFGRHDQHREQAVEQAKQNMCEMVKSLHGEFKDIPTGGLEPKITWSVVVDSDVAHTLTRIAENGEDVEGAGTCGRCDIIAMSTHGHSDLRRWAIGSTTDRVLKATKLPMFIVRPKQLKINAPQQREAARPDEEPVARTAP
jgi:nucleotide-binding universal stress UspA family protein